MPGSEKKPYGQACLLERMGGEAVKGQRNEKTDLILGKGGELRWKTPGPHENLKQSRRKNAPIPRIEKRKPRLFWETGKGKKLGAKLGRGVWKIARKRPGRGNKSF